MCVYIGVDPGRSARDDAKAGCDGHAIDSDFAVAREPRETRLDRRGELGDIVEKQRATARGGELAVDRHRFQVGRRVGERRAEQQPFDADGVGGAAFNGDERPRWTGVCVQIAT
jgi:hypothetical protein